MRAPDRALEAVESVSTSILGIHKALAGLKATPIARTSPSSIEEHFLLVARP